jgi:TonB-dependent starch-binding outer membrane protein SusC
VAFDAPQSFARRVRANSLRVSLQGRNLLMATDYWGYDPEFNNFANTNLNRFIDLAPFPAVRQFSIQFDLGF